MYFCVWLCFQDVKFKTCRSRYRDKFFVFDGVRFSNTGSLELAIQLKEYLFNELPKFLRNWWRRCVVVVTTRGSHLEVFYKKWILVQVLRIFNTIFRFYGTPKASTSVLLNFIQQNLSWDSCASSSFVLTCQRFAVAKISDNGLGWK